ncbi:MAG: hypothetical protein HFG28_13200 [Eubacterium sp.]|nr:hypothetical protein [Eubacterium sp.]
MKIKKVIAVFLLCLIFILSVHMVKNEMTGKYIKTLEDFPLKYIKRGKALDFRVDVIISNTDNYLYKSKALKSKINDQAALSLISDQKESVSVNEDRTYYTNSNGKAMRFNEDYLSFSTNSELEKSIELYFSLFPEDHTADNFMFIDDLKSLKSLSGKREIENILYSLGLDNFKLSKSYILDYKTLRETKEDIDKYEKKNLNGCNNDWTEEDNCEYWIGTETWCGLPVFCGSFSNEISEAWMPIQILYTKDGIEKLQIFYHFDFEKETDMIKLKPFEEIADALEKKYSKLLTDNKYLATKAELFFGVDVNQEDTKYQMKPVWNFTLKEYKEDLESDYVECQEIVDAETAKILEIGG